MSLVFSVVLSAFVGLGSIGNVDWKVSDKTNEHTIVIEGTIPQGYFLHPMGDSYNAITFSVESSPSFELVGQPREEYEAAEYKGEKVATGRYILYQDIRLKNKKADIHGTISYQTCHGDDCGPVEDYEFSVNISGPPVSDNIQASQRSSKSLWTLILQAILWGFAMLLTPCVFPMVPMTISFFLKGGDDPKKGRFRALMYGLFIVLLYTVPISIIIGITWLFGGDAVTADIFNWLSTHWLPNIIFFAVFMIFAASFFGAFEIVLPSKWVNGADKKSAGKGLGGVFFLALTLVLVSFSCTGPIVGTVLIQSTSGQFWMPMVTMLAFSLAFALPFTIFALFPSLLDKLPQSGGWLNSVKVVLGFIEIALGLKFLSTADQVYHWGILNREVYLAIWIVCFTLLGFYLLGKIRFKNDSLVEYISVKRLFLAIIDFAFVVYLIPGMWGAPLSAISGYLPPLESQEFVLSQARSTQKIAPAVSDNANSDLVPLPHNLWAYDNLEKGLEAARQAGKPVFVDISGHGCVNCREMEAKVWSDPRVQKILRDDYILVVLYMDDKKQLPENQWVTTASGKVLKQVGRVNSYIVKERFGVNAQPNYVLLDPSGNMLAPVRGYNLNVDDYINFLEDGLTKSLRVTIDGSKGRLVGTIQKASKGSSAVAIVCHGLTGNRNEHLLLAVVDSLSAKGISSVRFDFNGHGESDGAFSKMTVGSELADLAHIYEYVKNLKWVDKNRISLVGHSQGALVSGLFAGEKGYPMVHSIALMAPAACIPFMAREGNFFGEKMDVNNIPDSLRLWGKSYIGRDYVKDAAAIDVYDRTAHYAGPVLIVQGNKDDPIIYKYAALYPKYVHQAEYHELKGLSHSFAEGLSAPAKLIADFLSK